MKKLITTLTAIVIFFSFTACEEIISNMTMIHNVEIQEELDISLEGMSTAFPSFRALALVASNDTTTFIDSLVLNLLETHDADSTEQSLAESLEQITSIDIDTLSIEVLKSYDDITLPNDFKINTLTVSFYDGSKLLHNEMHQNVLPGDEMISPVTASGLASISSTLQDHRDLTVIASGSVVGDNSIPYFVLKVRVIADVTTPLESMITVPE